MASFAYCSVALGHLPLALAEGRDGGASRNSRVPVDAAIPSQDGPMGVGRGQGEGGN